MPVSNRHSRAAVKAGSMAPTTSDYEITDPHHKADLRGEFAGAKVRMRSGKQIVSLTERQAKFYLDSGAIKPVE